MSERLKNVAVIVMASVIVSGVPIGIGMAMSTDNTDWLVFASVCFVLLMAGA